MNKNINNNLIAGGSSSALSYRGNVTINFVKGNRVVRTINKHNVGCKPLFDFLINCLANNYNGNDVPKYLMGYTKASAPSTPDDLGTKAFSALIPVSNVETNSTNQKTTFKFVIPSSYVDKNVITQSTPLNVLAIYNTNNKDNLTRPSAFIYLDSSKDIELSDLGSGISIIVLWEMIFSNVD